MSNEKESYTVEQAFEDLVAGMNLTANELTNKLNSSIKELSKSEMHRALDAIINYPDPVKVYSTREESFIKNLVALHGLHLQLEINALGELQKEQNNPEGENNE